MSKSSATRSKTRATLSNAKIDSTLAIGVLGVLVLIGSDTYAAEPVSKRKPATAGAISKAQDFTQSKLARSNVSKQPGFRKVDGLANTSEVIEFGKPPQRLGVKAPQAGHNPVARYHLENAWPSSAPAPKQTGNHSKVVLLTMSLPGAYQPGAYQLISAGGEGQTAADGRHRNEIHIESLSWTSSTAIQSRTPNTAPTGLVTETRDPLATEGVTIVSERLERVMAAAPQDGNTIYVSTQWVPSPNASAVKTLETQHQGVELGDISQIQQIDINKAMKRFDKAQ